LRKGMKNIFLSDIFCVPKIFIFAARFADVA